MIRKRGIDDDETTLLNVDLDILSQSRLEPLVEAFGEHVVVLHVGPEGRRLHGAHVELSTGSSSKNADGLIRGLVALVKRLPRSSRRLWNTAKSREFNIGVQAAHKPHLFELRLDPETLDAVASVGGRIVVTVYAAELPEAQSVHTRTAIRR